MTAQAKPLMPGVMLPNLYPGLFDGVIAMTPLDERHEAWALRAPGHNWALQTQSTPETMAAIRLSKTVKSYSPLSLRELLIHCGRTVSEPWAKHDKAVEALRSAPDVRAAFTKVEAALGLERALVALTDARARAFYAKLGDTRADDVFAGLA